VLLRCSPDEEEKTAVWLVNGRGSLTVDALHSTRRTDVAYSSPPFMSYGMPDAKWNPHPYPSFEAPFAVAKDERLRLRIFLDGCMLEAFANDRQCVTQMIFPVRADSLEVKAAVFGGEALIHSVNAWDMGAISVEDRRKG
jgi:beta-fructofuranosidase